MKKELWRPIPNYSNYEASNLGRIRSLTRTVATSKIAANGNPIVRTVKGTVIKHWIQHDGRQYVKLVDDKGQRSNGLQVHRLIAFAWHGVPPDETYECDHKNQNRLDNRPSNLHWMSADKHKAKTIAEQGIPVVLESVKTGKAFQFPSFAEASRRLKISTSSVSALANNVREVSCGYRIG